MAEAVSKELNLPLGDMRRADIPRFFHAANVQSLFPSSQMMPRFKALLAGMGIDLDALHLTIDDKATPRKNPRAVCFPVVVPTDVRLSIKPQGGVDDYAQLFHEGGHATHFASTTTPVWEFQQLGNGTVTEAYAFLFEDLLEDPKYLGEVGMTGELLKSYVRSAAVKKLYMLRRYCAKVIFERAWHAEPPLQGDALKPKYKELLSRAYGFPMTDEDAARVLTDHDDFFYSADYLRAWFLAAQVSDALERKFGATWWHSPEAGKTLRALMSHGNGLSADEVVQQLAEAQLDFAPLVKRVRARLP
jgi:oligoendopeptidase F